VTAPDAAALAGGGTVVVFTDAVPPALAAGDYEIEVTQRIKGDIGGAGCHEYRHVQAMRATGPHFGLSPQDVFAVHPPAGAEADWSDALPSVVLASRGLPWLIALRSPGSGSAHPAPWLAVLLLKPDEIAPAEPGSVAAPTGTRQILLTDYLMPPPGVRGPAFTPGQIARFRQEHPADFTVTTVDIRADVFSRIAPSLADTEWLAHTRAVRDEVRGLIDEMAAGEYAVVVGNRLVDDSDFGIYIAHLVSLEGLEDALPPAGLGGAERVRLLSLTAWTFTSRDARRGFRDVMQRLRTGPLKLPDALGAPTPSSTCSQGGAHSLDGAEPHDDPAVLVRKALALGYTAADYRTRLGERTVAWYRGPLLPVAMKPNPQPPFLDADAALVYDPDTGMFDVSLAVAWQAGRLLALADREVTTALAEWVRRARRALVRALGRDRLSRTHPILAPGASAAARARALMAAELAPGAGAWGPPIDLSGLLGHVGRLPGLVAPDDLPGMLSGPGTPTSALLAAVRSRGPGATAGEAGRPAPAPAPVPARDGYPARSAVGRLPAELKALVADPGQADAVLRGEPLPSVVSQWLDRLALLHAIPFPALVPDARALPPESIRFAFLDRNWISALLDGALSVAAVDEPGYAVLGLLRPAVHSALPNAWPSERAEAAPVFSGFLLRSTAVADWPGLRVEGYADRAGRRPLPLRRLDRLSPTVLIALFEGRLGRVDLAGPAQGSGFGVLPATGNPDDDRDLEVRLRGLGDPFASGELIPGAAPVPVPLRSDPDRERRVVEVTTLHADVEDALRALYQEQAPPLGPGAFGLQLVTGGEVQAFENLDDPPATGPERR
jgi:hypothetical protein